MTFKPVSMLAVFLCLPAVALPAAELPQWRETTATNSLRMGYQLAVADLNSDGRPDLIAVDERGTELAWFQNPTWERRVILRDVPCTINLDVHDYDGDGIPEIAMGYLFETRARKEHRQCVDSQNRTRPDAALDRAQRNGSLPFRVRGSRNTCLETPDDRFLLVSLVGTDVESFAEAALTLKPIHAVVIWRDALSPAARSLKESRSQHAMVLPSDLGVRDARSGRTWASDANQKFCISGSCWPLPHHPEI